MSFRILGIDPAPFRPLFALDEAGLACAGAQRRLVDVTPGYPDRIEIRDAEPGEVVLLLNHVHHAVANPYRASHAIFVAQSSQQRFDRVDEVPAAMRRRLLSLRAFDQDDLMIDADVVEGRDVERLIERQLGDPRVRYVHAHYAKPGCYAARIERA
jgi:hypothetical protein